MKPRTQKTLQEGVTLIELIVAVTITSIIVLAMIGFQNNFFTLNRLSQGNLSVETDMRRFLKDFSDEVRSATAASTGAYMIDNAGATSFSFYTDIDNDNLRERIRYTLTGTTLQKGTIKPTGSPLVYNVANEVVKNLVQDVTGPAAIFSYFDGSYDGTGGALPQPVSPIDIRFVRITLTVDPNGTGVPAPQTYSSQATIRNLRSL